MHIEYNLDKVLEKKGLSISSAAKMCELSYPTIYWIVKNKNTRIDLLTISKILIGLEVDISELFRVAEN